MSIDDISFVYTLFSSQGIDMVKKNKNEKKSKKKDSQLLIRVNGQERDRFVQICEEIDSSAAREIRLFMRKFIAEYEDL